MVIDDDTDEKLHYSSGGLGRLGETQGGCKNNEGCTFGLYTQTSSLFFRLRLTVAYCMLI